MLRSREAFITWTTLHLPLKYHLPFTDMVPCLCLACWTDIIVRVSNGWILQLWSVSRLISHYLIRFAISNTTYIYIHIYIYIRIYISDIPASLKYCEPISMLISKIYCRTNCQCYFYSEVCFSVHHPIGMLFHAKFDDDGCRCVGLVPAELWR